jgi:hypothetical protein
MNDTLAWPGVVLAVSAIRRARGRDARKLALVKDSPKLFKRPTDVKRRTEAALAQYDTALKVLRDAERAVLAPKRTRRGRRLNELDPGPARSDSAE